MDAQVLSHAERDISCLGIASCPGIASSDADGKWFSVGNLTFSDPPRPDTKDVIFGAGELGIQVKMITGDHVAIAKETCRVIGKGTKIPTTKDIPANEADTLLHSPFLNFTFFLPNHFLQSMYMDIRTSKQLLVRFCPSSYLYVHEDTFLNSKLLLVSFAGFVKVDVFASVRSFFQEIKVKSHCVVRFPLKVLRKSQIPCEIAQEKRARSEKPLLTDVTL